MGVEGTEPVAERAPVVTLRLRALVCADQAAAELSRETAGLALLRDRPPAGTEIVGAAIALLGR